ncbi:four-helix bundle copper-binding protein [Gloeobacter violaceus]|uniref:Glr0419 protein n=1 Tax=Gloeobacter violaceus (strain ATCC 29082 / PCC 7421) TaxID=251221 RepID=Q7NNJ2_GLOVI|nr:four-helix bundle copper-binding protein [Gloeobacter violaceus]BAC88360.1 glr0419 [Gloeobacter violaceus PCC 7421]
MDGSYSAESNVQDQMQQCIDLCLKAHDLCLASAMRRIELGGEAAGLAPVRLLLDCAELCQTHANLMSRRSEYHARLSPICAAVCEQVAAHSEMAGDDPQFQACAEACRRAGESCQKMTYADSSLGATV